MHSADLSSSYVLLWGVFLTLLSGFGEVGKEQSPYTLVRALVLIFTSAHGYLNPGQSSSLVTFLTSFLCAETLYACIYIHTVHTYREALRHIRLHLVV